MTAPTVPCDGDWRRLTWSELWAEQTAHSNALRAQAHARVDALFDANLAEQYAVTRALFERERTSASTH